MKKCDGPCVSAPICEEQVLSSHLSCGSHRNCHRILYIHHWIAGTSIVITYKSKTCL